MEMVGIHTGHDRSLHTQQRQRGNTMDGLGDRNDKLFHLDIHGHQGQRHSEGVDGRHVSTAGTESDLELVVITESQ